MKSIVLRNLPPDVARRIQERAREEGISPDTAALHLLRDAVRSEATRRGPPYDDLDTLAGTWSEAEAKTFDEALADQRTLDPTASVLAELAAEGLVDVAEAEASGPDHAPVTPTKAVSPAKVVRSMRK